MKIKTIETFAVAFLLSVSLNTAQAEEKVATDKAPAKKAAGKQTDRRADRRPTRETIIKRFDKDGDGKLSKAEEAAQKGLRIFTIGAGTPDGELIPVNYCPNCESPNQPGRSRCRICNAYLTPGQEFIRDENGNAVRSRLNESMLEELAETTGGFYLRLEGAQTIEVLYKNGLAPLPKSENNSTMLRRQRCLLYTSDAADE